MYLTQFIPDNFVTYNMNDKPKINILMSENIRQNRQKFMEYFNVFIYHNYQPNENLHEIYNENSNKLYVRFMSKKKFKTKKQ